MMAIGSREVWIGAIVDRKGKIQAISFSFDRETMMEGIMRKAEFLRKRGVKLDLRPDRKAGESVRSIEKVMVGRISNEKAFNHLDLSGITRFESRVYEYLTKRVKRGRTITYGELATELGTSARAVGGAMRRNPYPIVVPCHRVVSKSGLGGYTPSLEHKRFLLELEA